MRSRRSSKPCGRACPTRQACLTSASILDFLERTAPHLLLLCPEVERAYQGHRARRHVQGAGHAELRRGLPRRQQVRMAPGRASGGPGQQPAHDHRRPRAALPWARPAIMQFPTAIFSFLPLYRRDGQPASLHAPHPNLILWLSGHRHVNVITPQAGADAQHSFWEVETSSLRDFPQQFRTFDIRRNSGQYDFHRGDGRRSGGHARLSRRKIEGIRHRRGHGLRRVPFTDTSPVCTTASLSRS